jgi:hypothetical protein
VQYQGVSVAALPMDTGFIPLVVLRTLDIEIQARSVGLLLDRWEKLYGLLDTPNLYKGNRFAVTSDAIKRRALKEGVSDAVLSECAAFAADLSRMKRAQ